MLPRNDVMKNVLSMKILCSLLLCVFPTVSFAQVRVGLDRVFQEEEFRTWLRGKRVALVSHNAAINQRGENSLQVFLEHAQECSLKALCTLEHGFYGAVPAETLNIDPDIQGVRSISLYGAKTLPEVIVEECDILVYDVQDIGVRSYTFVSALLFLVKASAKHKKPLIVLDRPNPLGGEMIDGPLPVGERYAPEIPYCYGLTPGELAKFFQAKYAPDADVRIVPMLGWLRSMHFDQTGCVWVPTSPQIPTAETAFFYAATGIVGALSIASIGIGYTLPFKVIGAPWMESAPLIQEMYKAKLPGIRYYPFSFEPFWGKYKLEFCSGCLFAISDARVFHPVEMQSTLLGVLKHLYPREYSQAIQSFGKVPQRRMNLIRSIGSEEFMTICEKEPFITWPLRKLCVEGRAKFQVERKPFLLYPDKA